MHSTTTPIARKKNINNPSPYPEKQPCQPPPPVGQHSRLVALYTLPSRICTSNLRYLFTISTTFRQKPKTKNTASVALTYRALSPPSPYGRNPPKETKENSSHERSESEICSMRLCSSSRHAKHRTLQLICTFYSKPS